MQIPVTQVNAAGGAMQQLYDNIASGAIANWDVSAISQAYNHLMLVMMARGSNASNAVSVSLRVNNDSNTVYNYETMQAVATGTTSATEQFSQTSMRIGQVAAASATANYVGSIKVMFPNYKTTTFYKSIMAECINNVNISTNGVTEENEYGQYNDLGAITRLTITPSAGNFIAGSRLSIYGLL